jgi:CheY-like chemotaxis protein
MNTDSTSVLLADDHIESRAAYSLYLASCGFEVIEAGDGEVALASVAAAKPDVVVLDMKMPKVDGWHALSMLRANPATSDLPIIALTGNVYPADHERAVVLGCDAFLGKPCPPQNLVAAIQRVLSERWQGYVLERARSVAIFLE